MKANVGTGAAALLLATRKYYDFVPDSPSHIHFPKGIK